MDSSGKIPHCRNILPILTAGGAFFLFALVAASVHAQAELKLARIIQASGDDKKFDDVAGLHADAEGNLRLLDNRGGALVTLTVNAAVSLPLGGKQGLFSSRKLGGLARVGDGLWAVVKTSDDTVAVLDEKGAVRYAVGESGSDEGRLQDPAGVAYSPRGRFYVADRGNGRVAVFGEDGLFLFNLGVAPEPQGLDKPTHVALDAEERVYVLDAAGARVSVFNHQGKLLSQVAALKLRYADNPPRFTALAADSHGRLFLADRANGKVLELEWKTGKPGRAFGSKGRGRGQFDHITAMTFGADGRLVLADSGNQKLEVYELPGDTGAPAVASAGKLDELRLPSVRQSAAYAQECSAAYALSVNEILCLDRAKNSVTRVGAGGQGARFNDTFKDPTAAAADAREVAIVDDERIKIFSLDGKPRFTIGRSGGRDGEFDAPGGVFLADKIYVSDSGNRRIQMFSRDGIFLDKIANAKEKELLRKPGAVVVDAQGNIYVADNGYNKVRVFSDKKELLFEIGEDEKSPHRFVKIHDLAVDKDDNVYILASTAINSQAVQVFSGPKPVFSFGAHAERIAGLKRAVSLSVAASDKTTLALYDLEDKKLKMFQYRQVPSRVGGLAIKGGLRRASLHWQKTPGSFVAKYFVYAEAAPGDYQKILETAENKAVVTYEGDKRYTGYRITAVSALGVEGVASQPVADIFQVGYALYRDKKFAESQTVFARAYKDDAGHGDALEYLGRSLLEQGKTDEALRHFQELAKLPGFETAGANLEAETLFQGQQFLAARAVLDKAVAGRHADARTYLLCGEIALRLGDSVGASDCLENALKRDGKNAWVHFRLGQVYVKIGAVDKGLAAFNTAVQLAPDNALLWQHSGEAYQALNKHKEALERFNKALALDGLNAAARLGAARSHIALKDYEQARSIALSLSGDAASEGAGQYLLGIIALANNQAQEAALALAKAAHRDPHNAAVWLALADAQAQLKEDAKVKDALRQAIKADAASFDGPFRLGMLEYAAKNFAAAADALSKAVALQPGHYDARYAYAQSLLALERYKEAADQAREAVRLAPKQVAPLVLAADSAQAQGKIGDAIDHLKKAVALAPSSAALHSKLGKVYLENNIYDVAQTHLDKAVLLEPKNPAPHALLGLMYLERRLFDSAIKAFGRAVELEPSADHKQQLNQAYAEKKRASEFAQNAPRVLLQDLRLTRVFSSAYKQYGKQPVGAVKVKNASASDYKNLKLSFHIKGYMDFASQQDIPLLKANEILELPLHAAFNNKILTIDEDTGVQVEVKLSFFQEGQQSFAEITRPMTIYGKNAIQWANFAMVGSFVTPKDDLLKDFVRQTVTQYAPTTQFNKNLVLAMTLFDTLSAHGVKYLVDPNSPYSQINAEQVDYVQFPRETLKVKSGDCDDLSVLLSAGLENLGVETALVDVPGHLFMMFNTGLAEKNKDAVSLQDDLLVIRNGEVWIPLEATMIATSFFEAWAEGAKKYRAAEQAKKLKVYALKDAWAEYVPVTLAPANYTLGLPAADKVTTLLEREHRILVTKGLDRLIMPYRAMLAHNPADQTARLQIAIIYARHGVYDLALKEFERLLEQNPRSSEAHNNRGNIYYTLGQYDRALDAYAYAEQLDPADGGIKLNLALAHYRRGQVKEAVERYREAVTLNKSLAEQYRSFEKLLVN